MPAAIACRAVKLACFLTYRPVIYPVNLPHPCRLPAVSSCRLPPALDSLPPSVRTRTLYGAFLPTMAHETPTKKPQGVTMANHCDPLGRITFTGKREPLTQEKSPRMFQAVTRNPLGLITFAE